MSFDKAPPLSAPLRFFLTAPLFLALAGVLLAIEGGDLFASRWMPATLAATHLATVGFMLQIMLGALIQILPVVAGASLPHPLRVARVLHLGLSLGTLLLAGGFLFGQPGWLQAAAATLAFSVAFFLVVAGRALWPVASTSPTIRGIKLALFGLLAAVGLGVLLAYGLASGWTLPFSALADLHAGWALGAWGGILLMAIAYVVVPMFQLTPGYAANAGWRFPLVLLGVLFAWSCALAAGAVWLMQLCQFAAALSGALFVAWTLRLQSLRRRARTDATYRYWQLGLLASALAFAMLATSALRPEIAEAPAWTPIFGILLIFGGFVSFIVGMAYKIVPFLAWLHLQDLGRARVAAPPMNKLLPDRLADRQFIAHALALAMLVAAALWPEWLARPAGLAVAVSCCWLWSNLFGAWWAYRRHQRILAEKKAA